MVVASHGMLDALTTGGLGVEFLWPFDAQRFFAPIRFIPVAPLGARMLSGRGLSVLLTGAVLFLPAWTYVAWPRRRAPPGNRGARRGRGCGEGGLTPRW